jgi:hypothetical protein
VTGCALPFVCSAVGVEVGRHLDVLITDCLFMEREQGIPEDLDVRLGKVWFNILNRVEVVEKKSAIKLKFRAVGGATEATRILQATGEMLSTCGFCCEGVSFIEKAAAWGRVIFVPSTATVKLYFAVNSRDVAVLYARADDTGELVPFRTFPVGEFDEVSGKVLRFELKNRDLAPISICKNELPDYMSWVHGVCRSMMEPGIVISRCEEMLRAQVKREQEKKKQKKPG